MGPLPSIKPLRDAATVVVVRAGPSDVPEILFLRRPQSMRFLPGYHTFPGGAVHDEDRSRAALALSVLSPQEASAQMGGYAEALPLFIAAVRELFEETGVLHFEPLGESPSASQLNDARSRLIQGASFPELIRELRVKLGTHQLRFHSRWIAPETLPVRFDSRVFVAPLIGDPTIHPGEADALDWMSASEAIAMAEVGGIQIAPPTAATVAALARYERVDDLLSGAGGASHRPVVDQLSPMVKRIVAPNPSMMTGPGTNTYLVGNEELIVIDPGSMEQPHLDAIAGAGNVGVVALTHGHSDHFSGALDLCQMTGASLAASHLFWERSALATKGKRVSDGDTLSAGAAQVRVVATPGHSADHIAFWLEEEKALFCGDLLMGSGTPVIAHPDGNLRSYMESLDAVASLKPSIVYPGHFDPRPDAAELIGWYKAHRLEREQQILGATSGEPRTSDEVTRVVYAGYDEAIMPVAERTVTAHLMKLVEDGVVLEADGRFVRA
ncbi:MAG TPA: MBL fold metallo-hydrolase [Actinomycetota bacterium]|nr:MBL fold metallo-hydrolase [Actinomycetota bacterium]